jgi:hypothetical protein
MAMKILHILNDGPGQLSSQIIEVQSRDHEVEVVDLSTGEFSYQAVVDIIFACDKVISW